VAPHLTMVAPLIHHGAAQAHGIVTPGIVILGMAWEMEVLLLGVHPQPLAIVAA